MPQSTGRRTLIGALDAIARGHVQGWLDRDRQVTKGEKGLTVLQSVFRKKGATQDAEQKLAGFRPLALFALDQTEGEPLKLPTVPDFTADEAFDNSIEKLREVALALPGNPVSAIDVRPRKDEGKAFGWYQLDTKAIVVITDEHTRAQVFKTLAHEVAHALLHPVTEPHTGPEREVEAESTASGRRLTLPAV